MKVDPHRCKELYCKWLEEATPESLKISPENFQIIRKYLSDMEQGRNVAKGSRRGPRGYPRLRSLGSRLVCLSVGFREHLGVDPITSISEDKAHEYFQGMRSGRIQSRYGREFKATGDYVKDFRAFWRWYMLVNKKAGKMVKDICYDLDDSSEKAPWVYLTEKDVRKLCNHAFFKYKVMMMLLFDSGMRSPTELANVRVGDFSEGFSKLHIREETSKTFGRTIRLLLCSKLVREFVEEQGLDEGDFLFEIKPSSVNGYLKSLARRVLGDGLSRGRAPFSSLTMYDFRHSAACYWLPRYKSESALKYRFGWKRSEMIHYYTEFLGMRDTITEEDLLEETSKTEIERKLVASENEKALLQERLVAMEEQVKRMMERVEGVLLKAGR